jgi:hypothetical protein
MDVEAAKAYLAATMSTSPEGLYSGKTHCNSCGVVGSDTITLLVCSGCQCVAYCNVDCQRAHWKSGHKKVCKQRQELCTLLVAKHFTLPKARAYVSSISEDRLPAVLAVQKNPAASGEEAGIFKFMEDTVTLKRRDIKKMAMSFRAKLNRMGVNRNAPGDVYMRDGCFTLLMDFKCKCSLW